MEIPDEAVEAAGMADWLRARAESLVTAAGGRGMSREHPTPEELDAIEQHQYGAYDVNLPDWYTTPEDAREALEQRRETAE